MPYYPDPKDPIKGLDRVPPSRASVECEKDLRERPMIEEERPACTTYASRVPVGMVKRQRFRVSPILRSQDSAAPR